ncbi:MAG: AraC family transcriptional regulator [Deltaproteobacteria bacterium]|jgi:AraC-like DNA-binding protein|nr:AraC family transcriptional regulator [Deltaproteobacteria bacterium]
METEIESLKKRILRLTNNNKSNIPAIPGLSFYKTESPTKPENILYEPRICLIAQGSKKVVLADETYIYDESRFLLTLIDIPALVQITEASKEKPYLGLVLKIDINEIAGLVAEGNIPYFNRQQPERGMATGKITLPLINAFNRLTDLIYEPENIPILAATIKREIFYRLLVSEQGMRLRNIVSDRSQGNKIAQIITWLKNNFTTTLHINGLAKQANMSKSAFHNHFRVMTSMSPLQFQKWLRLNEARRLMLTERIDASTAAFRVGYESPSQFSREYSRLFGKPPLRDIKSLHNFEEKTRKGPDYHN